MKLPSYSQSKHGGTPWFAAMPEHWETRRLKFIADVCNGRDQKDVIDDDGAYDVFGSGGVFGKSSEFLYDKVSVLLGRKGTIDKPLYIERPFWTVDTMFYTRIAEQVHPKYFFYLCLTIPFDYHRDQTTLPSMTQAGLSNVRFAFAPPDEQQQIAAFLDWKTGQIDALIARKQELLEKLKEKRLAVITQAVTRGLNPDAPLRDSGIPWLGQVPEHWEVGGFTKYVEDRADYRGKTPEKVREGVFLVTAKNIKGGTIDYDASQEFVREEEYSEIMSRGLPRLGDLLFTTEAPLGEVANVDREDIALAQRVIKFRGEPLKLNNYFAKYWMMSAPFQAHLKSLATGSTALGIKASKLFALRCVVPPLEEQQTIVAFLDEKQIEFSRIEKKVDDAIALLSEYRTALITAATTGKIDVRRVKVPESVA